MTRGLLQIPKQLPTTARDWEQFVARLNDKIRYDGERVVMDTLTTIASRSGTDLDTLLSYLTDTGRANSQTFLPQVQTGGVSSRQDAGPVTAEADSLTAEISIAAHTLQYGDRVVAYNAGTIAGLDPDTSYYVYTDDPDYVGGAVSYSATTNGQIITANNGRYFVGAVRTTVALSVANITAATTANPVQFTTSAPHGWNTGNTVTFSGLPGDFGAALNGTGTFTITRTGASSFTVPVNGSGFSAFTSGGTASRQTVTAISGQGGASGWIDMAFLGQF